jgi:oligopeptidase B
VNETPLHPPVAERRPVERVHHGDTVIDDYEWLRDKDNPDTLAYLEAENAYTAAQTAHLADLREAIFGEIKRRTQETDLSVPSRRRDHWYYSRIAEGQQYPLVCRTPVADDDDWTPPELVPGRPVDGEVVLVDGNALAEGHDFFSLGAFSVSLDGSLLAYSTDVRGDERYTIAVLDIASSELLPDSVTNTYPGVTWSADGSCFFYVTFDDSWRPDTVWRHAVGAAGDDALVYHEADGRFWASITRTTSDRYLVLSVGSRITSEVRILDADDPTGRFRVLVPRETGVEYDVDHAVVGGHDRLVVVHNKQAENFTVGLASPDFASLDDVDTLIAHQDSVRISDVDVSEHTVAVNLRENGLPQVRIFTVEDAGLVDRGNIGFDEVMFGAHASGFSDWRQPFVRLGYSSWLTPATIYDYEPTTGRRHLRKQQPVLGGYDPAYYVQEREWVTAADGARIPISVVRHRGTARTPDTPTLLYGYGAYEISGDPHVSIPRLSLLDRGMVYVHAHVRGGGEMGRRWYEEGRTLSKMNTFTDFIACARHLVATGTTSPQRMIALGGSAGGLLMGAVANLAPDAFGGIVAQVPFVDALTTILDPSLPLTEIEWDEWGDPLHDAEVYAYMKSYTPYENVADLTYPPIYALTSINDTRVYYVEPAKWIAQLRARAPRAAQVLLKCEMSAGHGGASGRYDAWREIADYYAWIVEAAGASHLPG